MTTRLLGVFGVFLGVLLLGAAGAPRAIQLDPEEVIFYPTYGFKRGTEWIIPMRAKVQEPRNIASRFQKLFGGLPSRGPDEDSRFRARFADFLADDESNERVRLQFDGDPDRTEYRIADDGGFPETDGNGIVTGRITVSDAVAQRLLTQQSSTNGWLTYHAVSQEHTGVGRVRLIGPTGLSIISDIDDTIKVTEVPAGHFTVVVNTFFREFVSVADMSTRYKAFGDAAFHYVSGGPWQLYRPVSAFLIGGRHFPEGSFHMKPLSGGISAPISSIESLHRFVQEGGTFDHKVSHIMTIIEHFPDRTFILIGDSGEQDPDVYREVKKRAGTKVQEIIIRDVVNMRQNDPARLAGMTVVEASTIPSAAAR